MNTKLNATFGQILPTNSIKNIWTSVEKMHVDIRTKRVRVLGKNVLQHIHRFIVWCL